MARKRETDRAVKAAAKTAGKMGWTARLIIFALLTAALCFSLIWQSKIDSALGLKKTVTEQYGGMSTEEALSGSGGDLNLHFVDVGQGDACVIELPDERNVLIDSGSSDSGDKLIKYIEDNVKTDGGAPIAYFDIVILTHSDEDHCGEMADVLSRFPARTFYRPNQLASRSGFNDPGKADLYGDYSDKETVAYMKAIEAGYAGAEVTYATDARDERQNVIAPAGKSEGEEGYYEINFYSPVKEKYADFNDYSPIMILEYGGNRVALSGDAEEGAEADFVALASAGAGRYSLFDETFSVQAVKLGHHGSRTSSSEAYLETITTAENRPNVMVVISCGLDNKYGHPHKEVLDRLKRMGFSESNVLRTDINGNLAMSIRFQAESAAYRLFVGADAVRVERAAASIGALDITWREIVIAVVILAALVLIVLPLVYEVRKKAQKAARKAGRR